MWRGLNRQRAPRFSSALMLQPVEQRVQIESCFERNQARCLCRKSLSSKAPTGQRSTTLPASGLSTGWPGKDVDLGMVAPAHHLELAGLGDLAGEPDAPGAHDAPVHVELDQVRDVLARVDDPFLDEAMDRLTVAEAVVLQAALAGLVADRAVERDGSGAGTP